MIKLSFVVFVLLSSIYVNGQQLVINEIMSSNQSFILDEDGDDSDWIEIFNTSGSPVNLHGFYLSDNSDNLSKWAFPDTLLEYNNFLIVFASGKNRAISGNELHTGFSIKSSGEELFISYNDTIIHSVPAKELDTNTSYGLFTDGNLPYVVFNTPTPGFSNDACIPVYELMFSKEGGIYRDLFMLNISCSFSDAQIYYTIDGTLPTTGSMYYSTPLELGNNLCSRANINQIQISSPDLHNPPDINSVLIGIVIRAAAFDSNDNRITDVITNSYFISELDIYHHDLPVVSICAEHKDLFNYETGIFVPGIHWDENNPDWTGNYYQRGDDWEKEIHIEFYESPDNTGFKQNAGLRTHGGNMRRFPQKGMRLYARSEYGESEFEYPIFKDKPMVEYKRLILRPSSSSWSQAGIEDHISNKMVIETEIDAVASRPCVVYLNGEYWGIYFLQERVDNRYISENYDINKDSVDIIENWWGNVFSGNNDDFLSLYSFIEQNDLSITSNYNIVTDWIDIDNFIDYQIFEIFIANYDWPSNNMKCWREQKDGAKWRWIFFDGDAALQSLEFDGYAHALNEGDDGWPTCAHSTLFLRKLLSNQVFYMKFFNRMEFLLNNQLNYSTSGVIFQNIISGIGVEIDNQIVRFKLPENRIKWADKVYSCNTFLSYRPCEMKEQTVDVFNRTLLIKECSFENISVTDMLVFPNPTSGRFTLTFESSASLPATIQVSNVVGQSLITTERVIFKGQNTICFNKKYLPEGLLFVNVITENQIFSAKMLCIK